MLLLAGMLAFSVLGSPAWADRHGPSGGRGGHGSWSGESFRGEGHGHFRGEVFVDVWPGWWVWPGPAWWYPPPYYDPYPRVVVEEPTVYVEKPATPTPPPPDVYWYYCPSARAYYPTVPRCDEPWVKVPPRPE